MTGQVELGAVERQAFVEFLACTPAEEIPEAALEQAKLLVASTFASAAAGRSMASVEILRAIARDEGGKPEARVWFADGLLLPAAAAAGLNASASDAAASDDSDLRTGAHTGTAVVAASFAAAGRSAGTRGSDVLAAIALGYEAGGRIGAVLGDGMRRRGFHPCLIAALAATVAAARILQLDAGRLTHALELTAATSGGLLAGSDTECREYAAGAATARGFRAALAAAAGYRAGGGVFVGPRSVFNVLSDSPSPAALTDSLGESWDIVTDLLIKLRPGAYLFTSAVDAACELARDPAFEPDTVDEVIVAGPSFSPEERSPAPSDFASAVHSLPYYIASVFVDGDVGWHRFDDDQIADPLVQQLAQRVRVVQTDDRADYHWAWGATVTAVTAGGSRRSVRVDLPRQTEAGGVGWAELQVKFDALVSQAVPGRAAILELLAAIRELDLSSDARELTDRL